MSAEDQNSAPVEETAPLVDTAVPEEPAGEDAPPPPPMGERRLAVLEALLFSAAAPLHLDQLALLLGLPQDSIRDALMELQRNYAAPDSGLALMEVAGGFQLATRPDVSEWIYRLHGHRRRSPITPALLETLAIVAYKQPVARADIEAIRGVDCGGVMRSLQDAGLAEIVGRKEVPGRPALYGTTDVFLKTFGLRSLEDLPSSGDISKALTAPAEPTAPAESDEAPAPTSS